MRSNRLFFWLAFILGVVCSCGRPISTADLVIVNANIWTGNSDQPYAQAMAIEGERIIALGDDQEVKPYLQHTTQVVDLEGQFVTPGFIDCHVHFLTGGMNLSSVQLRDADTPETFARRIGDFAQKSAKGTWILGGEWDHELWGGAYPEKSWIDSLTPDHPVFVRRLDGHMALANSLALELAGIHQSSEEVDGGVIQRDASGAPTGLLKDNAMNLVGRVIPPPSSEILDSALQAAMNYVASHGVTTVHHVGGTAPEGYLSAFRRARDSETLKTRIYAMMPLEDWDILSEMIDVQGRGDDWLKIGGLKGFVDGSLGSHTALFHEPYSDHPQDSGIWISSRDSLAYWIEKADEKHLQVAVHAIGDKAIHYLLNTFEHIQNIHQRTDQRFRIEHAQHIDPIDYDRFQSLAVIPSMQPYHAIDDGRWAEKVIGPERIQSTYAFRSLMDAGATVAFGSDWFVAPPIPLAGIYAAVTRRTLDGAYPEGWVPEQKISVEEALLAYTMNAAYASFDEDSKGTLEIGKLADFVVMDADLTRIDPVKIRDVQVVKTFVGGKVIYGQ